MISTVNNVQINNNITATTRPGGQTNGANPANASQPNGGANPSQLTQLGPCTCPDCVGGMNRTAPSSSTIQKKISQPAANYPTRLQVPSTHQKA